MTMKTVLRLACDEDDCAGFIRHIRQRTVDHYLDSTLAVACGWRVEADGKTVKCPACVQAEATNKEPVK